MRRHNVQVSRWARARGGRCRHPQGLLDDAAGLGVAGLPDPTKGEVVKAWVVLKPGTRATADELRAWCRERLAPYKVPVGVEFRDELPKSMVGKVLRRTLAQEPHA